MSFAVLRSLQDWSARFDSEQRTVVTVGNFDGIHVGHQKILKMVMARAQETATKSVVVTFDPHPFRLLRPDQAPRMIQTLDQRLLGFETMGLNAALVLHFDLDFSKIPAADFMQHILVDGLRAQSIMVGENFRFGYRGTGTVAMLEEFAAGAGFQVVSIPALEVAGQIVSSTGIRNAVSSGEMEQAALWLGRPVALTGESRTGAGRGRTILFPTLNLVAEQELQPAIGVYATESILAGKSFFSVTNVGRRPTFDGRDITVESHLFDFSEILTFGRMELRFHKRLRGEQKFESVQDLRAQIARDIAAAQEYFEAKKNLKH